MNWFDECLVVVLLKNLIFTVKADDYSFVLFLCVGRVNEVRKLIKDGNVNINTKYDDGEVPIVLATKSGTILDCSPFLLKCTNNQRRTMFTFEEIENISFVCQLIDFMA